MNQTRVFLIFAWLMVAVLLSLLAYGLAVSVRVRTDGTVPAPGTTY